MVFLSYWNTHKINTADPAVGWLLAIILVCIAAVAVGLFVYGWRKYK